MSTFDELANLPEHLKTMHDYSYPELRKHKLDLYEEMHDFFQLDFFEEPEEELITFLGTLENEQRNNAKEFLSQIVKIVQGQIEALKSDEVVDEEQVDSFETLQAEEVRLNRFLIKLGYFK